MEGPNLLACQGEGSCFGEFQVFGIQDQLGTGHLTRYGTGPCYHCQTAMHVQETAQTRAEAVTLAEVFEIPADAMLKWGSESQINLISIAGPCRQKFDAPFYCWPRCMEASPADRNVFMEGLKAKYMEVRASLTMAQDPQQSPGSLKQVQRCPKKLITSSLS